jgi:hypothetical protein
MVETVETDVHDPEGLEIGQMISTGNVYEVRGEESQGFGNKTPAGCSQGRETGETDCVMLRTCLHKDVVRYAYNT